MELSYEILMVNRNFCVDETVEYVRNLVSTSPTLFKTTTRDIPEAYRDVLNRIVDSCIDCFIYESTESANIQAASYWRGNTWLPLAINESVELQIHNFLKNIIVNYIFENSLYPNPNSSISQILSPWPVDGKQQVENFLNIEISGINRTNTSTYLHNHLSKRFTAKFWTNQPLESYKLDAILEAAYIAPSKQGYHEFEMHVITESPEGEEFKQWLYWEDTWCLNGIRQLPGPGLKRYNGQVLAPAVIIWLAKTYPVGRNPYGETEWLRTNNDVIISSTFAMCQAEQLGVNTGFCGTIGNRDIADRLGKPNHTAVIAVGFGYAMPDNLPNRKIFKNGVEVGFDLSNTDHTIRTYDNRRRRPLKHTMINYV